MAELNIKNRTPEQKKYRDDLHNDLLLKRSKWTIGLALAQDLLAEHNTTYSYIISKYWYTQTWAMKLLEMGKADFLMSDFDMFQWLDGNVAMKLLEVWSTKVYQFVLDHLDTFIWLQHKPLVMKLLENEEIWVKLVKRNFSKFEWMDKEVAIKLITIKASDIVASNIKKFHWLDEEIAIHLVTAWEYQFVRYLDGFDWLDTKKIAMLMIKKWSEDLGWLYVAQYIRSFASVHHKALALALIAEQQAENLLRYLDYFVWLDLEVAKALIKAWYAKEVDEKIDRFQS